MWTVIYIIKIINLLQFLTSSKCYEEIEGKFSLSINININFGFWNVNMQAKLLWDHQESSQMSFFKNLFHSTVFLLFGKFSYDLN